MKCLDDIIAMSVSLPLKHWTDISVTKGTMNSSGCQSMNVAYVLTETEHTKLKSELAR